MYMYDTFSYFSHFYDIKKEIILKLQTLKIKHYQNSMWAQQNMGITNFFYIAETIIILVVSN